MGQMSNQDKLKILELARLAGGYDGFGSSGPTDWDEGDFAISPESLIRLVMYVSNKTLSDAISAVWEQSDLTIIPPNELGKISQILSQFQRS